MHTEVTSNHTERCIEDLVANVTRWLIRRDRAAKAVAESRKAVLLYFETEVEASSVAQSVGHGGSRTTIVERSCGCDDFVEGQGRGACGFACSAEVVEEADVSEQDSVGPEDGA